MRFLIFICCFLPLLTSAQPMTPPASPRCSLTQQIGLSEIRLSFSQPGVKGRKIFGELAPYNILWRAGANEATSFTCADTIWIQEKVLPPGHYSLYFIPQPQEWTAIFSRQTGLWGERGYDPQQDALRITVKSSFLPERVEIMDYRFRNITFEGADLDLEWENTRIRIPLQLHTGARVQKNIQQKMAGAPAADDYYQAARYQLDSGGDLKQALEWMEKRGTLGGEQFGILRYKALIEKQLGQAEAAIQTMQRSLELARSAGNDHYVRMNERSLRDWKREVVDIRPEELLRKSLAYHDPKGQWNKIRWQVHLLETRPGGPSRNTRLDWMPAKNQLTLIREQEEQQLEYRLNGEQPSFALNGRRELTPEELKTNRLDGDRAKLLRNYYTYLWALPMKLQDPGTQLHAPVQRRFFNDREYLELKVTYEAGVGKDTWYFYFDETTAALRGYRFYHDEAKNDGEYILLEDEVNYQGMRIPKRRSWYTHGDNRLLGTDVWVAW